MFHGTLYSFEDGVVIPAEPDVALPEPGAAADGAKILSKRNCSSLKPLIHHNCHLDQHIWEENRYMLTPEVER